MVESSAEVSCRAPAPNEAPTLLRDTSVLSVPFPVPSKSHESHEPISPDMLLCVPQKSTSFARMLTSMCKTDAPAACSTAGSCLGSAEQMSEDR